MRKPHCRHIRRRVSDIFAEQTDRDLCPNRTIVGNRENAAAQNLNDSLACAIYGDHSVQAECTTGSGLRAMKSFDESRIEYADFAFERKKVVCYGLLNTAGGATTVLNFPSANLADEFRDAFLRDRNFQILQNDAQVICLADYDTVMRKSDQDPRVRYLKYNRDFMMGTLSHATHTP